MYCQTCGEEINDNAEICTHCGCRVGGGKTVDLDRYNEPATGMGVLFALFLSFIGLIIGMCLYPAGTVAHKTFVKGWLETFFVLLFIGLIFFIILMAVIAARA